MQSILFICFIIFIFQKKNKKPSADNLSSFTQTEGKTASHFFTGGDSHITVDEDLDPFSALVRLTKPLSSLLTLSSSSS